MKDSPSKQHQELKMVDPSQSSSYVQDKEISDYSCSDCSVHSDDDNSTSSRNRDGYEEGSASRRNRKKHKKKFFRALQHVVDFTSAKKLRQKKLKNEKGNDDNLPPIYPREGKRSTVQDSSDNEDLRPSVDLINHRRNSSLSTIQSSYYSTPIHRPYNALLSRSNSSSELSTPAEKPPSDPKRGGKEGVMAKNLISGFVGVHLMLLISLAVLVLLGKVCAILCTIAWLLLLPLLRSFHGHRWSQRRSTNLERRQ